MNNQTQINIVKVMDRGLVVIPKMIREKAEVSKGTYIKIIYKKGEIILKPLIENTTKNAVLKKNFISRKAKYSKSEGLKILLSAKNIKWTKKDNEFLKQGRKQIEDRLKTYDKV